jgi:hypothetical protein
VKLPGYRPGLPGKVVSFHIVPLDPACKAWLAGARPGQMPQKIVEFCFGILNFAHGSLFGTWCLGFGA